MTRAFLKDEDVFVVREALSLEECAQLIRESELEGYSEAPITMGESTIVIKDYRSNERLMRDDPELAAALFERLQPWLPEQVDGWRVIGFNERLRFYRYDSGQSFSSHYDGSFIRCREEESRITVIFYLNDGFEGGHYGFRRAKRTCLPASAS